GAGRISCTADASGEVPDLPAASLNLNNRIHADDGGALVALLGLDKAVAVDKQPASISLTASGRLGDLQVDARLAAARLEATGRGTLHLSGDEGVTGAIDLRAAAADVLMLHRADAQPVPVTLRTRLGINNGELAFDAVSAVVAGTGVRGRVTVGVAHQPVRLDGRLEADSLDVAAVAAAIGGIPAAPRGREDWAAEPFTPGGPARRSRASALPRPPA